MSEQEQPKGDHDPDGMTRGARRGFVVLAIAVLATGVASTGASIAYANSTEGQLREQLQASCAFAGDLGTAPVPDKPRPSRLGVSIVADSRAQWRKLHCPGSLPASPGLIKWGRYYRIPVS